MSIDARKHEAPAAGESPRRQTFNDLSLSINDPIPVASVTERAQVVQALADAGFPGTETDPIHLYRTDLERYETYDGTRYHVGSDTRIGRGGFSAPATVSASPAWSDLCTVTATTLGGTVTARVDVVLANANSGAYRDGAIRVLQDGVSIGSDTVGLALVTGQSPKVWASNEWDASPTAGSHTWTLQANASAGGAVLASRAVLTITERP